MTKNVNFHRVFLVKHLNRIAGNTSLPTEPIMSSGNTKTHDHKRSFPGKLVLSPGEAKQKLHTTKLGDCQGSLFLHQLQSTCKV